MKLIVGLGNPGKEYENTRHNVGFMALDKYISDNKMFYSVNNQFKGVFVKTDKAIFLKPQTYMNLSGEAMIKFSNYFKIDLEDILVIYDDKAIPLNSLRIRDKGSAGGHNGIKNIIAHYHTEEFKRVRIGIGDDNKGDVIKFVLGKFSKTEMIELNETLHDVSALIDDFVNNERFDVIMTKYNKRG